MEKSGNSEDRLRLKIVSEELEHFEKIVGSYRKLLFAIGNL